MMGQTKEAEKMTNHIVSEETGCLECYRLLSAIYSKQENHDKVKKDIVSSSLDSWVKHGVHLSDSPVCMFISLGDLKSYQSAYPILWKLFTDIPLTPKMSPCNNIFWAYAWCKAFMWYCLSLFSAKSIKIKTNIYMLYYFAFSFFYIVLCNPRNNHALQGCYEDYIKQYRRGIYKKIT